MIKSLELKNFKAFKESGKVDFKKINILVGPNSGGKSSFIKGLLTIKNTLDSIHSSGGIELNKDIGDYLSIVHGHNEEESIGFSFEFDNYDCSRNINIEYLLFRLADEIRKKNNESIKDTMEELRERSKAYSVNKLQIWLKRFEDKIVVDKFIVNYLNGEILNINLEDSTLYVINIENMRIAIRELLIPERFYFKINENALDKASVEELKYLSVVHNTFEEIKNYIKKFTDNIIHIESLRDKPKRVEYITTLGYPNSVGSNGENMMTALINSLEDNEERINYWLREFDLAESIKIKSLGNGMYSLFIKDKFTGVINNLLDVGVGTSQLLPIIIETINSPKNSILIIEEPEVHIHPNAQSKLADLFVECSKDNEKKFIIETHSIFLITQIEILVAKGLIKAEDVGIYYFQHNENGASIKDMKLTANGQFEEEWPSGFFDVNYNLGKILFGMM